MELCQIHNAKYLYSLQVSVTRTNSGITKKGKLQCINQGLETKKSATSTSTPCTKINKIETGQRFSGSIVVEHNITQPNKILWSWRLQVLRKNQSQLYYFLLSESCSTICELQHIIASFSSLVMWFKDPEVIIQVLCYPRYTYYFGEIAMCLSQSLYYIFTARYLLFVQ